MNSTTRHIESLRQWMRAHGLAAYIFPSTDPHSGEYIPDYWKTREWISGFNGSAGTAVVTLEAAALWTDSRYWLAAEEQLAETPFEVIHCGRNVATAEELTSWIKAHLPAGKEMPGSAVVGLDAWTNTTESVDAMKKATEALGMTLRTDMEPTTTLWTNRPPLPSSPIEIQPLSLAGRSIADKLNDIRKALHENHAHATLLTQLDEIAWTLNLRGSDVHCTPVFVSYLLILPEKAILYIQPEKVTEEVAGYLHENGIETRPYHEVSHYAEELAMDHASNDATTEEVILQLDPAIVNRALFTETAVKAPSPVALLRAIKNPTEIEGFHHAMRKDGVAMVKFLRWLEEETEQLRNGKARSQEVTLSELSIDQKLTALRTEQKGFRGLSFDTIAGYGAHGAIVHYEATPETDIPLEPRGLLLLDSGAQYVDGTTDITRTIPLGPLTDEERRNYTLVLKGHLRLAMAVFPEGTTGTQLDVLARYAMWQEHKNYGHGTGHGVGSCLSVHEGPHQFRMNYVPTPLQAGMTVTIEPGIYIAGSHGVRTENTMLIVEDHREEDAPTTRSSAGSSWLRLEPLTLCPIHTAPILRELMTPDEIEYLNYYHAHVREELLPLLTDEADKTWLIANTEAL